MFFRLLSNKLINYSIENTTVFLIDEPLNFEIEMDGCRMDVTKSCRILLFCKKQTKYKYYAEKHMFISFFSVMWIVLQQRRGPPGKG